MIKPAPGFRLICGPLGLPGGPGSPGNGPGSKNSAGCTRNQPRRPIQSPIRGHFVFLGPTAKRLMVNMRPLKVRPVLAWGLATRLQSY